MIIITARKEPGLGGVFSGSLFIHLLLLVIIARFPLLTGPLASAKSDRSHVVL